MGPTRSPYRARGGFHGSPTGKSGVVARTIRGSRGGGRKPESLRVAVSTASPRPTLTSAVFKRTTSIPVRPCGLSVELSIPTALSFDNLRGESTPLARESSTKGIEKSPRFLLTTREGCCDQVVYATFRD